MSLNPALNFGDERNRLLKSLCDLFHLFHGGFFVLYDDNIQRVNTVYLILLFDERLHLKVCMMQSLILMVIHVVPEVEDIELVILDAYV